MSFERNTKASKHFKIWLNALVTRETRIKEKCSYHFSTVKLARYIESKTLLADETGSN